jgi:Mor family transcriptional regulator
LRGVRSIAAISRAIANHDLTDGTQFKQPEIVSMSDTESTFDQLTQVLGEALATEFSLQFAGREMRIAKMNLGNTSLGREISKVLGKDAFAKFQAAFGGKRIYVAAKPVKELVPASMDMLRRNESIRRERKKGRSRTDLAKEYGLSERSISMITGHLAYRVRM